MKSVQGVEFFDVIFALKNLLQLTAQLPERLVVVWFGNDRPALEGKDVMIWFRPLTDVLDPSPGPQEYGNRADCMFEVHLVTRSFADHAQVDERRAKEYYDYYWRIILTLQNRNLFAKYIKPLSIDDNILNASLPWEQPVPDPSKPPLTVGTMLMTALPVSEKTQREEGTMESRWQVKVPVVLALIV